MDTKNLDSKIKDLLCEFKEKDKPLQVLFLVLNSTLELSLLFSEFISNISLRSSKTVANSISYDVFGRNVEEIIHNLSIKNEWEHKDFHQGIFNEKKGLIKMSDNEKILTIFEYYLNRPNGYFAKGNYRLCIKKGTNKKNISKENIYAFFDVIEKNIITNIDVFEIEKNKLDKKCASLQNHILQLGKKSERNKKTIEKLTKEVENIKNDRNKYIAEIIEKRKQDKQIERDKVLEEFKNIFRELIEEIDNKITFYSLMDFIITIQSHYLLSIFSNYIVRKISLKIDKSLIDYDESYRLLKYVTYYVLSENKAQAGMVRDFFELLEKSVQENGFQKSIIYSMSVFFTFDIFLIFIDYLYGGANFYTILYLNILIILMYGISKVLSFKYVLISGILAFCSWILIYTSFPNFIKVSILENNFSNNSSTYTTGKYNLCVSGTNLEDGKDVLLENIIQKMLSNYEKNKGILLSQDQKNAFIEKTKKGYVGKESIGDGNTIDMTKLKEAFKEVISPEF